MTIDREEFNKYYRLGTSLPLSDFIIDLVEKRVVNRDITVIRLTIFTLPVILVTHEA